MNLNFLTKINFRGIFGLKLHLRAVQVKQGRVWQAGLIQTAPTYMYNVCQGCIVFLCLTHLTGMHAWVNGRSLFVFHMKI